MLSAATFSDTQGPAVRILRWAEVLASIYILSYQFQVAHPYQFQVIALYEVQHRDVSTTRHLISTLLEFEYGSLEKTSRLINFGCGK